MYTSEQPVKRYSTASFIPLQKLTYHFLLAKKWFLPRMLMLRRMRKLSAVIMFIVISNNIITKFLEARIFLPEATWKTSPKFPRKETIAVPRGSGRKPATLKAGYKLKLNVRQTSSVSLRFLCNPEAFPELPGKQACETSMQRRLLNE